jgi:hypothetical protein
MCIGIYHWSKGKKSTPESVPEAKLINVQTNKKPKIQEPPKQVTESKDYHIDHLKENTPRKKLCEILKDYDMTILKDSKRFRAILNDLCKGQNPREINAILTLLDEHIPQDLLKSKNKIPFRILSEKYQQKLKENTYLSEDLIKWTIDSWALALDITNVP